MATRGLLKKWTCRSREKRERLQGFELPCIHLSGQPVRLGLGFGTSCPTNKGVEMEKLAARGKQATENPRSSGPLTSFSTARYKI